MQKPLQRGFQPRFCRISRGPGILDDWRIWCIVPYKRSMRAWSSHIICSRISHPVLLFQNVTDLMNWDTQLAAKKSLFSLESLHEIGSFICTAIRPEDRLAITLSQPWHSCYKPVTKLRWKFPVVFVRTCSTEPLRPEESTCFRDP